jgi:hypothetical protein
MRIDTTDGVAPATTVLTALLDGERVASPGGEGVREAPAGVIVGDASPSKGALVETTVPIIRTLGMLVAVLIHSTVACSATTAAVW